MPSLLLSCRKNSNMAVAAGSNSSNTAVTAGSNSSNTAVTADSNSSNTAVAANFRFIYKCTCTLLGKC